MGPVQRTFPHHGAAFLIVFVRLPVILTIPRTSSGTEHITFGFPDHTVRFRMVNGMSLVTPLLVNPNLMDKA